MPLHTWCNSHSWNTPRTVKLLLYLIFIRNVWISRNTERSCDWSSWIDQSSKGQWKRLLYWIDGSVTELRELFGGHNPVKGIIDELLSDANGWTEMIDPSFIHWTDVSVCTDYRRDLSSSFHFSFIYYFTQFHLYGCPCHLEAHFWHIRHIHNYDIKSANYDSQNDEKKV